MSVSDGIIQYFAKLGLDASGFLSGIEKSQQGLLAFYRSSTVAMAGVTAAIAGAYAMQQRFGNLADEISDLSTTTGMSTEKIQQLQYAAILSNDSFSTVATGINYLTLSMEKAGDATSEASKAFAALGVSTAGKSPDQVFEETTASLMSMEDETKRNSIAMSIYGRSWKEMLPYMEDYIKNKEKIQKTPTFSKQELQDLQDAKKAWDDLGNSVTIYTGKILAFTQKQYSSDTLDSILTLDAAYRKLFSGNVKGYLDDAAAYHDKKAREEAAKITEQAANAQASGVRKPEVPAGDATKEIDAMTDALKKYKDAVDDVADSQTKLNDINKEYTRDLQTIKPTDVQGFIDLRMRHDWAVEDQTANINTARTSQISAAGEVGRAGMAAAGITITGPITVNGDKSFEKMIEEQRIRAGVR